MTPLEDVERKLLELTAAKDAYLLEYASKSQALHTELDHLLALQSAAQKLSQLTDVEKAALKKEQAVQVAGVPSAEVVGTLAAS